MSKKEKFIQILVDLIQYERIHNDHLIKVLNSSNATEKFLCSALEDITGIKYEKNK